MKRNQNSILQAFQRALMYLSANAIPIGNLATSKPRHDLESIVEEMVDARGSRDAGGLLRKGLTHKVRALRTALVSDHIRAIAAIAASNRGGIPPLHIFKAPPQRIAVGSLVASALLMADAAKMHEAAFVAEGLPADFIPQLIAAAEAVEAASVSQGATTASVVGQTARLKELERRGRQTLRILDALANAALLNDPIRRREWAAVRRISSGKHEVVG